MFGRIGDRLFRGAFDNVQIDANDFDLIPHRTIRDSPFPHRVQYMIARMTGIHPDQGLFAIETAGQLSIEQEKLFCESLETLEKTPIGKHLFSTIAEKLAERIPPQNQIHIILHERALGDGCYSIFDATTGQIGVHLDFEQFQTKTFTFVGKKANGNLGFFQVQYPLSLILGHELGHIFQYLEATDTNSEIDTEHVESVNERHWNAMMAGVIGQIEADCNALLEANGRPTVHFNPVSGLQPIVDELIREDMPAVVRSTYETFKETLLFIRNAWNQQFADLPNILPERRLDGQTQYSDGGLLSQIMRATDQEPADSQQRPKFFKINEELHRADGKISPETLRSIQNPDTILARWGHSSPNMWSFQTWNNAENPTPLEQKQCWQKYAKILLESVGLDLGHLPRIATADDHFF